MSTGQIALIGQPKPDRKAVAGRFFHYLALITQGHNNPSTGLFLDEFGQRSVIAPPWLDAEQVESKITACREFPGSMLHRSSLVVRELDRLCLKRAPQRNLRRSDAMAPGQGSGSATVPLHQRPSPANINRLRSRGRVKPEQTEKVSII